MQGEYRLNVAKSSRSHTFSKISEVYRTQSFRICVRPKLKNVLKSRIF